MLTSVRVTEVYSEPRKRRNESQSKAGQCCLLQPLHTTLQPLHNCSSVNPNRVFVFACLQAVTNKYTDMERENWLHFGDPKIPRGLRDFGSKDGLVDYYRDNRMTKQSYGHAPILSDSLAGPPEMEEAMKVNGKINRESKKSHNSAVVSFLILY